MNIFITGASRGLGMWLTASALQNGHTVFAGCRRPQNVQASFHDLTKEDADRLHIVKLDVQKEETAETAASFIRSEFGALDSVVNNAGILLGRGKRLEDSDLKEFQDTFETNVFGPVRVLKHLLPLVRKGEHPSVVNISSDCASLQHASVKDYPYSMSKAALNMLSFSLKKELQDARASRCTPCTRDGFARTWAASRRREIRRTQRGPFSA